MNGYLGFSIEDLKINKGIHTAREISGQPELWEKIYDLVLEKRDEINAFLNNVLSIENIEIILTGAGTSAFIGLVLEGSMQKNFKVRVRAVATTDLVTHPEHYLLKEVPTLLISFARSGNSPESFAAVEVADKILDNLYNIVIICNKDGYLTRKIYGKNDFVLVLPKESNDEALAMTGSFTSMVLAGFLISKIDSILSVKPELEKIIKYGNKVLAEYAPKLYEISKMSFKRAIFLGSGALYGCAKESHLKLQELTNGKVICKNDSYLGFRHGPKVVIDENTLIVYLLSNSEYVKQYEFDLINDINHGDRGLYRICIGESLDSDLDLGFKIEFSNGLEKVDECLLSVVGVLPAQILGFYKSLVLGLHPDSPSQNGTITRVVEGVRIYPYLNKNRIDRISL